MQDERTIQLIGQEPFHMIGQKRVLVFGLGGVGSYVVEALARSGISHFVLVDHDKVALSNLNRQLIALHSTIGQKKITVMTQRLKDIRPNIEVAAFDCFYLPDIDKEVLFKDVDYIVDAIDTVTAKIDIVLEAEKRKIPLISCMGTGNKTDPTALRIADIYQTSICPLCKVMRRELRKRQVADLKVVYSLEEPQRNSNRIPASMIFVPASAGLLIASEVIRDFLKKQ